MKRKIVTLVFVVDDEEDAQTTRRNFFVGYVYANGETYEPKSISVVSVDQETFETEYSIDGYGYF